VEQTADGHQERKPFPETAGPIITWPPPPTTPREQRGQPRSPRSPRPHDCLVAVALVSRERGPKAKALVGGRAVRRRSDCFQRLPEAWRCAASPRRRRRWSWKQKRPILPGAGAWAQSMLVLSVADGGGWHLPLWVAPGRLL